MDFIEEIKDINELGENVYIERPLFTKCKRTIFTNYITWIKRYKVLVLYLFSVNTIIFFHILSAYNGFYLLHSILFEVSVNSYLPI